MFCRITCNKVISLLFFKIYLCYLCRNQYIYFYMLVFFYDFEYNNEG